MSAGVIWHDLECGRYEQDLPVWTALAERYGSPVLDIGAGAGRVSLALAARGHEVVALDVDRTLLDELERRQRPDLPIETVLADARSFDLAPRCFRLIAAPMQTLQLLGGAGGHDAFLSRARAHLAPGGAVAVAIADNADFEEFEWQDGDSAPLPDIAEHDGTVFSSQPTAVRREGAGFVLERRREQIDPRGGRTVEDDRIRLDVLTVSDVEQAGQRAGLRTIDLVQIAPTLEHIGSEVVVLGA